MEEIQEYTNNGKWIAITTLIWNESFKQLKPLIIIKSGSYHLLFFTAILGP
jgi:hypothetical protein